VVKTTIKRSACRHTPFYCEENIWHLCGNPAFSKKEKLVVIISNYLKKVVFLKQRAGDRDGNVLWDYHVIMMVKDGQWMVWDLDTWLPFPCPVTKYIEQTFPVESTESGGWGRKLGGMYRADVAKSYAPLFKLVKCDVYRKRFSSNRKHMRDKHGRFTAPPPPWRMINPGRGDTFYQFIDMHDTSFGQVIDSKWLLSIYGDGVAPKGEQ
jgi:protein N-terminal glutamine amidohydrolase